MELINKYFPDLSTNQKSQFEALIHFMWIGIKNQRDFTKRY
jgi:hypothetical protein